MRHIGEQSRFLPVTALQRLVIAISLLITFMLAAAYWAEQQSSRSVCLLVADHSSGGIWLADVDRGMGATLRHPHQGISPHLFTATFPNSPVVLYVDEDTTTAIDGPHSHLAILSVEHGPLLPRIPVGSFYYPDVPKPEPNAKIYPGVSDYINFDLTPDGQHLVYAGHNADGHAFLRTVSLDGGEVINRSVDQYPVLNGWSPDAHYFMTLTFDPNTTPLTICETP